MTVQRLTYFEGLTTTPNSTIIEIHTEQTKSFGGKDLRSRSIGLYTAS